MYDDQGQEQVAAAQCNTYHNEGDLADGGNAYCTERCNNDAGHSGAHYCKYHQRYYTKK